MNNFLPICKEDLKEKNINMLDFIFVTGDAYIDHPSFGAAILSRYLESFGYNVGIISQPCCDKDYKKLGTPRLGFLVSAGNLDSMVAHYTVFKKKRSDDAYTAGGKTGKRPDRAVTVYCKKLREFFGDIPIIIGGIEASLRRFAHYDYWSDSVMPSILFSSGADLISFGMGERQTLAIAAALNEGKHISELTYIMGTAYKCDDLGKMVASSVILPSFEEVYESNTAYAKAAKLCYDEQDPFRGKRLIQAYKNEFLIQNPPAKPLSQKELDEVYSLPFTRSVHPIYKSIGTVPGIKEIKFSITSSRGCFGSCNFCSLSFHQGRIVQSRSEASILCEAEKLTHDPEFKGYINDVGGPSANFRQPACEKQLKLGACKNRQCLFPYPCPNLKISHEEYLKILRKIRALPKVKRVFIRSGIRYDYLLADKNDEFFNELCAFHISGQLKVAPEHISPKVLNYMGKPGREVFDKFKNKFYKINSTLGKEQFLVPYLMSSHPGCGLKEAIELSIYLKENKIFPEQVQDFYPTPGTLSTCMYYTGIDPVTMKKVYIPKSHEEKAMQRALLQFFNPKNYDLVKKALIKAGRSDLIGFSQKCLIRPNINKTEDNKNGNDFRRKKGIGKDKNTAKERGSRAYKKRH